MILNFGTPLVAAALQALALRLIADIRSTVSGKNKCPISTSSVGVTLVKMPATLTKGNRCIVAGRMEQRDYETNAGEKRTVFEVVADEIGPSLRWATAQVERTERSGGFGGGGAQASHHKQHLIRCTATKSRSDFTRTSVVSRHLSRRTKNNGEKPSPRTARTRCRSPQI